MSGPATLLQAVFGDDWEMRLIAAGIVGGDADADVDADKERVRQLAAFERPDLDDEALDSVQDAWFEMWCESPNAEPGER